MIYKATLKDNLTTKQITVEVSGEVIEDALMALITDNRHTDYSVIAIEQI